MVKLDTLSTPISSSALETPKISPVLDAAYYAEYRARADIQNAERPILDRLRRRNVVTPEAIADVRMKVFEREAYGLSPKERQKLAIERFRPMKPEEVHAEHKIDKALAEVKMSLDSGDWGNVMRQLDWTERDLKKPDLRSEMLQQFRAEFGGLLRSGVSRMVENGEARRFLGMARQLGPENMAAFSLDAEHIHLDEKDSAKKLVGFVAGLDKELARVYSGDSRVLFMRDFSLVENTHFVPYKAEEGLTYLESLPTVAHAMARDLTEAVRQNWRDTVLKDGTVIPGKPSIILTDANELGFGGKEISAMSRSKEVLAEKLAYGVVHEWRDERDEHGRLRVERPGELLEFAQTIYLDPAEIGDLANVDAAFADLWVAKVERQYFNEVDEATRKIGTKTPGGTLTYAGSLGRNVAKILELADAPNKLVELFEKRISLESPSSHTRAYTLAAYQFIKETPGMNVDEIVARGGLKIIVKQLREALENEWRDYEHEDGTPAVSMPLETLNFAKTLGLDMKQLLKLTSAKDVLAEQFAFAVNSGWEGSNHRHTEEILGLAEQLGLKRDGVIKAAKRYGLTKNWQSAAVSI
jgi:hypothetical protein